MEGIHLILDLVECQNKKALEKVEEVEKLMDVMVKGLGFHVVKKCFHQFEPFGATALYLLSESHFSIHTFYEEERINLDIYCCQPFDVEKAVEYCKTLFGSKIQTQRMFQR
jgi:S-adenosylmethionine decarboxylase